MRETVEHAAVQRIWFVVAILALLYVLINVVVLAGFYWGDEYAVPAWDERSMPPPKIY